MRKIAAYMVAIVLGVSFSGLSLAEDTNINTTSDSTVQSTNTNTNNNISSGGLNNTNNNLSLIHI